MKFFKSSPFGKKKKEDSEELPLPSLTERIAESGKVFYKPASYSASSHLRTLSEKLEESGFDTHFFKTEELFVFQYKAKRGFKDKIGLGASAYRLCLLESEEAFRLVHQPAEWLDQVPADTTGLSQKEAANWWSSSEYKNIEKLTEDKCFEETAQALGFSDGQEIGRNSFIPSEDSLFFEKLPKNLTTGIYLAAEKETVLACLSFSSLKEKGSLPVGDDFPKDTQFYLLSTSDDNYILAVKPETGEILMLHPAGESKIQMKKELGRDPVEIGNIKFLSKTGNEKTFHELTAFANLKGSSERMREAARLNWLTQKKNTGSNDYAEKLLAKTALLSGDPFDELSLIFLDLSRESRKEAISGEALTDEKLITAVRNIFSHDHAEESLLAWEQAWELSVTDAVALVGVITELSDRLLAKGKALAFHRKIREDFMKTKPKEDVRILFESGFAKHLIQVGKLSEAREILKKLLEELPREYLTELLPAENIDPTGKLSGQLMRCRMLDLLAEAEDDNARKPVYAEAAELQPLVPDRLRLLVSNFDDRKEEKAKELLALLSSEGLSSTTRSFNDFKAERFSADQRERLLHPALQEQNFWDSLQGWVASVNVPDHEFIRDYAERLLPHRFPEITAISTEILNAYGMTGIEFFISRGKKDIGIQAHEGNPDFCLIGAQHLDSESPYFMNYRELRFAFGAEMTNLLFNHARVTSNDVWEGAREKGLVVLDTVLSVLPAVGFIGRTLGPVGRFAPLARFMQNAETIQDITSKSRDVLEKAGAAFTFYKGNTEEENAKSDDARNLIATSRLMLLTADRAGLVFSQDIKAAVRSIFLSSRYYALQMSTAERYGLEHLLTSRTDEGDYRFGELAVRVASLFSFYLSEEYDALSELVKDEQ